MVSAATENATRTERFAIASGSFRQRGVQLRADALHGAPRWGHRAFQDPPKTTMDLRTTRSFYSSLHDGLSLCAAVTTCGASGVRVGSLFRWLQ
ncbi:hypothetical protein MRX96_041444 [Rhipicephalus microplus]